MCRLQRRLKYLCVVQGLALASFLVGPAAAATLRVPQDHATIQAAVDAAGSGDTVLVNPGTYRERIHLKEGLTLRSAGDDAKGKLGLKRAEATIIDGGGEAGKDHEKDPGVAMAERSTLDGLTVIGIGRYDDDQWKKHHATHGEEQEHEHIGQPGTAGIAAVGVNCTIRNNIVHHVGYTGIAIIGVPGKGTSPHVYRNTCYRNMGGGIGSMKDSTAVIEENLCFENFYAGIGHNNASPLVINNLCYANIRAGIGISEGSRPIVRGNKCYKNRRAGIGCRTEGTSPLIEDNDCYQNDMAGIGCRDRASPLIRRNRCHENALAGIGCQDGARPLIVGNQCYRNKEAGIGSQLAARAFIAHNECYENEQAGIGQRSNAETVLEGNHVHHNKLAGIGFDECTSGSSTVLNNKVLDNDRVAVGIHKGWKVKLSGNELSRTGGLPPILMVFKGAEADFSENTVRGSGVAGIRTEGVVRVVNNKFECPSLRKEGGPPQFAVWGLPGSEVMFLNNTVTGWRHALSADKASVTALYNQVSNYWEAGIRITAPVRPVMAIGNTFESEAMHAGVSLSGGEGIVDANRVEKPKRVLMPGAKPNSDRTAPTPGQPPGRPEREK
jgi:hypothetical protein